MLITTSFQPFCSLCQSANWLIRWFCLSLSSPERSWVKRRSLSFPVSSIWFVFSRSPSYFCHDVMIPLRTDWTRGRRESNWQPAERPAWAPGSSATFTFSSQTQCACCVSTESHGRDFEEVKDYEVVRPVRLHTVRKRQTEVFLSCC